MSKQDYSSDFIIVRRAVFMNLIARTAPIQEESLTPEDCVKLIEDVGSDYIARNNRGLFPVHDSPKEAQ